MISSKNLFISNTRFAFTFVSGQVFIWNVMSTIESASWNICIRILFSTIVLMFWEPWKYFKIWISITRFHQKFTWILTYFYELDELDYKHMWQAAQNHPVMHWHFHPWWCVMFFKYLPKIIEKLDTNEFTNNKQVVRN